MHFVHKRKVFPHIPVPRVRAILWIAGKRNGGAAERKGHIAMNEKRKWQLLAYLVKRLAKERLDNGGFIMPQLLDLLPSREALEAASENAAASPNAPRPAAASTEQLWLAFRALVNVREPWQTDADLLAAQDELLQGLIAEAGVTRVEDTAASPLDPRLRLWRGDITTLAADAIVNAANEGLTGCWAPLHYCIDNAIHTYAGIQLRLECARLMREQGHPEPTGRAKVTPAYNLSARHVIHTVGPIANGRPTPEHREQLAACYRACLDAATQAGDSSIAFCCISTGVFGFPPDEAAPIAVETVRTWLAERDAHQLTPIVVFNVFSEADEARYAKLLGM